MNCKWCEREAVRKQGRLWLCQVHYRYQRMRIEAKRNHKTVPGYDELLAMTPADMICVGCSRKMNWLAGDGQSTVASLQHDRDGKLRLICRACNTRHAQMDGDSFYTFPKEKKRCPKCKQIKELGEFQVDRRKWNQTCTYCRDCNHEIYLRRIAVHGIYWERKGIRTRS